MSAPDQAKVSSPLVSFCAELEAEPEEPPVVVVERISPLASLTMVVMEPSALNVWLVVVVEEEELSLPEAEEPEAVPLEEDVPNRLLIALLPLRFEMEEDIGTPRLSDGLKNSRYCRTGEKEMSIFIHQVRPAETLEAEDGLRVNGPRYGPASRCGARSGAWPARFSGPASKLRRQSCA